jgi:hypothetical protein
LTKKSLLFLFFFIKNFAQTQGWFHSIHIETISGLFYPRVFLTIRPRSIDGVWCGKNDFLLLSQGVVYRGCCFSKQTLPQDTILIRGESKWGLLLWQEFATALLCDCPAFFDAIDKVVFLRRYAFKIYLKNGLVIILPMIQTPQALFSFFNIFYHKQSAKNSPHFFKTHEAVDLENQGLTKDFINSFLNLLQENVFEADLTHNDRFYFHLKKEALDKKKEFFQKK